MNKLSSPIDLIKKSVAVFSKKENFLFFVKIYLPLLPFAIFSVLQSYFVSSINPWLGVSIALVNIFYIFVYVLVSLAGILAAIKVVEGNKLSVKEIFESVWKRYWKFLLLSFLSTLIIGFGFVLLIIPGVIFLTWYSFARFIFVADPKAGVLVSFGRSKNLVKGKFWKVFGRLLAFGGFSFLIGLVTSLIPYGVGYILSVFIEALFILPIYFLFRELSE